jgi:four helix bundle protein
MQNSNRIEAHDMMQNDKLTNDLSDRFLNFAADVMKLVSQLSKSYAGRHVSGQLFRSSTSAGANYEEACGAESRADFVHKLQLVLKELKESRFWLLLIRKTDLFKAHNIDGLIQEVGELLKIVAKSVVTAKKSR